MNEFENLGSKMWKVQYISKGTMQNSGQWVSWKYKRKNQADHYWTRKGMVHGICRNNYKQTCIYILNDNAQGTNYFLKW